MSTSTNKNKGFFGTLSGIVSAIGKIVDSAAESTVTVADTATVLAKVSRETANGLLVDTIINQHSDNISRFGDVESANKAMADAMAFIAQRDSLLSQLK